MDFFQHQETARRKTGLLIAYFIAAVALIVLLVYAIVVGAILLAEPRGGSPGHHVPALWDPALFAMVSLGTLALIGGGSLYRVASLAGGGHSVAEMMGGRRSRTRPPIPTSARSSTSSRRWRSPPARRCRRSTCSSTKTGSTPSPRDTRRATPSSASRAAVSRTSTATSFRGSSPHEFSHILNGDMRLNIRLIGVLYGILLISLTGWIIFRSTANASSFGGRRDGDRRGVESLAAGRAGAVRAGLYRGVLRQPDQGRGEPPARVPGRRVGRAVHAQSGRDRRGPQEDRRALPRDRASVLPRPRRPVTCSSAMPSAISWSIFATHPPLVERIRRIDPSFEGDFSRVRVGTAESRPARRSNPDDAPAAGADRAAEGSASARRRWSATSVRSSLSNSRTPRPS